VRRRAVTRKVHDFGGNSLQSCAFTYLHFTEYLFDIRNSGVKHRHAELVPLTVGSAGLNAASLAESNACRQWQSASKMRCDWFYILNEELTDCDTGQPKAGYSRRWYCRARFQILHGAFGRRQDPPSTPNPFSVGSAVSSGRERTCLQGNIADLENNRKPGGRYGIMEREHSRRIAIRLLRWHTVHIISQSLSAASNFALPPSIFGRVIY
jgi:hypothetical protein